MKLFILILLIKLFVTNVIKLCFHDFFTIFFQLSVSEVCYFCQRRVYVMERMSAEGMFFHRQCFRCNVCKCKLLLGSYAFEAEDDSAAGKFYCKIHYNRMIYNTPREKEKKSEPGLFKI